MNLEDCTVKMSSLKIIEDLEEDVRTVKDWLGKQQHLPQNIGKTNYIYLFVAIISLQIL